MEMRLQKFLAEAGVGSRRKCEEYIKEGKVKINGEIIREMGVKVDSERDTVLFEGKSVKIREKYIYIMLNKPTGYVTTVNDQFGRKTVMDLLKGIKERIYPVGRLDYDTEGLLLLTNDGDMTYRITHPKHNIEKSYIAEVEGIPTDKEMEIFRKGIEIDGYVTKAAKIETVRKKGKDSILKITIGEGRNRQVRKMCEKIGHPVKRLKRISEGRLKLGELKTGEFRYLENEEIEYLKKI